MGKTARATRLITWALMVAFVVALSANCVTAADMTPAQKACCAAMGHDCGRVAKDHSCCKTESQQVEQFSAAKRVTVPLPVAVVGPLAVLPDTLTSPLIVLHERFEGSSASPPGVPRYLLVSSLRI